MRLVSLGLLAFLAAGPAAAQDIFGTARGDWAGAYVGGTLGYGQFGATFRRPGPDLSVDEGDLAYSLLAGYQWQRGRLVYGGELAVFDVGGTLRSRPDATGVEVDYGTRVSGRLGYDLGRALVYGTAGYASLRVDAEDVASVTEDGTALGLGLDFRMSEHVTLGVDYTRHLIDNLVEGTGGEGIDLTVDLVGLRVAYRF